MNRLFSYIKEGWCAADASWSHCFVTLIAITLVWFATSFVITRLIMCLVD